MVRIDFLIFGYRNIKVTPQDLSTVTSLLLRASIASSINNDGTISVRERDISKIKEIFSGRIDFECSQPLGLLGTWKITRHKKAIVFSLFLALVLSFFLSGLVWDIRVDGNDGITDAQIVYELSNCGFSVGNLWHKTDLDSVENNFLQSVDDIAWININRRGTVAYVKVIERVGEEKDQKDPIPVYSNIVATDDCVIEEITVKSGVAVVKVGDTVKKGDLLIMGVLPDEFGGGFCRAEGQVMGRISDSVSVFVARDYEKSVLSDKKLYSCCLNLFKISINIFKLYGNLADRYDIIEKEISYSLLNKHKLPFSFSFTYIPEYKTVTGTYDDKQLISVASDRLDLQRSMLLSDSDLVRIRTTGEFTDEGYILSSDMVYLSEVGAESSIY